MLEQTHRAVCVTGQQRSPLSAPGSWSFDLRNYRVITNDFYSFEILF